MNVDQLIKMFLASHASQNHSAGTIRWYEFEIRRFFTWLEANQLHNGNWLHPDVIEQYLAADRAAGNSPFTIAGHYRALAGFFRWLVDRHFILESPMASIPKPKLPRKQPNRAGLDEFLVLMEGVTANDWIGARDKLIINTLFLCGLRLSECAKLVAGDFRTQEHLLLVRNGKGGHDRLIPLLPAVERAFVAYLFVRPAFAADQLFLSANGAKRPKGEIQANGIRLMLRRRCKRLGLRNLNPHSFRHGLAMYLLNSGGDMSLVQRILGHSQISTTARHYAEWLTDGVLREFSDKMRGVGQ